MKRLHQTPQGRASLVLAALLAAGAAFAAAPSVELSVTGSVTNPKVYGLADLQAMPSLTQTVSFGSGSGPQTHTYVGTSLWGVLGSSGINTNPAVRNDILNKVVLATGTDGYKVVFSLGEISPDFGNRPDLVAHSELANGIATPLGADGFARVTAPGDVKGGRYVSNLASLNVSSSGSSQAGSGGGASSQFSVTGEVAREQTFDLAALRTLPTVTEMVSGVTYTGVSFWDLINATVGLRLNPAVKNDVLGKYVVATGSDGYKSVFSLGELDPGFGNQPDLIAYAADGSALGSTGFARIVVPNDVRRGRWVSNLVSLEVLSVAPVPEPTTFATMLAGLAVIGGLASRRTRTDRQAGRACRICQL